MRTNRKTRPVLEALDGRLLLSGTTPMPHAMANHVIAQHQSKRLVLVGSVSGTMTGGGVENDTGLGYILVLSGRLTSLGSVSATGAVQTPGFIEVGRTDGILKLVSSRGTLTLSLLSDPQRGFSPVPNSLNWTVSSGTGIYKNFSGSGIVHLSFGKSVELPSGLLISQTPVTFTFAKP